MDVQLDVDSAYRQQRLAAFHPNLTPRKLTTGLLAIGVAFVSVGIAILFISDSVHDFQWDYTDCANRDGVPCYSIMANLSADESCKCNILMNLEHPLPGKFALYYGLTHFYQNHRRFIKSRNEDQLAGQLSQPMDGLCNLNPAGRNYIPCGLIANSMFNDVITLTLDDVPVALLQQGIVWPPYKRKFRNPPVGQNETLMQVFLRYNYTRPRNWKKDLWDLDPDHPENNGLQNEDLIVWMQIAALPNFRKIYRLIDHSQPGFEHGLPKGTYNFTVAYNYEVKSFSGSKSFILATTSALGAKNFIIGQCYIAIGAVSILVSLSFMAADHLGYV